MYTGTSYPYTIIQCFLSLSLYYPLLTEADATQLPVEHNTTGDSSHLCNGYQYNNSSSTADMIVRKKPLQDSNLHLKTERVFTKESPGDWNPVDWRPTQISDDLVITEEIILKELESLNITKSMGPDNLNPRVLHETRQQITPILTRILKESWQSGELPRDWKLANISAIHKNPNNYKPFSLTAICCKIMERIIKSHIINFLVQNHIISDQQLGFVTGRSTTLQLLRALEDWTAELDSVNEVDIFYIDFQKAFDSVPTNAY